MSTDYKQIIILLDNNDPIPLSKVLAWMKSDDIQIQGALYVLTDKAWDRIAPPLNRETICDFILSYYKKCIRENPSPNDYLFSRYEAGWAMASWIKHLWAKKPETNPVLNKVKSDLAKMGLDADKEVRECILNAVLEHIFDNKAIVSFFDDWKKDSRLKEVYDAALL